MEKTIEIKEQMKKVKSRTKIDFAGFALICITIGLLFLGRNTEFISEQVFSVFISWQMLLILIGLYSISHRGYMFGLLIAGIGTFYLIPLLTGAGKEWVSVYWPLIFVFLGLLLLIRLIVPCKKHKILLHFGKSINVETNSKTEDGFVYSNNSFSATKHVVMDEVFKGAKINNNFGSVELDLRRTTIQQGNTYIDVDSSFGGIEIRVPENWLILTELSSTVSGVSDDRHKSDRNVGSDYKLILRGSLSFSGIEIRN